ncbi:MAG TPA: exopolysaccharide Pel transporter PelG [Burkholderiaceae bacterium]|nr:exopolysaccharide Pel transporter PelG [Burkholderiaceae bacterium]
MAGIGFELRKLLQRDSLLSMLRAYAYAGVVSSGPWVLSIVGMLAVGFLAVSRGGDDAPVVQFQVTVTWLIACSLILTGFFQLAFTRYVADRLFERRRDAVVPAYHGVLAAVATLAGAIGLVAAFTVFREETVAYRLLALAAFVLLSLVWIATVFLSGLKRYRAIVSLYAVGYGTTVLGAIALRGFGLEGLLAGFVVGQALLFAGMQALIARDFPVNAFVSFDAFRRPLRYPTLAWIGLLYNLGVWIDKFVFWAWPPTSEAVIGPLRASVVYDLPVFLAYLSIIPGMAVFLVRIETDFVEHYDAFYGAVRGGGSLQAIERHRNGMVATVRTGLFEMAKIQAIAVSLLFVAGERLLASLGISDLYLPLLYVQTIAAGLQVMFLSILTVYFYLDKRRVVLALCGAFVVLNLALTVLSLRLGPQAFGYGFAVALLLCVAAGLVALSRSFQRLEYSTFMLQ